LRVTVQLVDAAEGFQIWAKQFDRKRENVLQIQEEISAAIVNELTGQVAQTSISAGLIDPQAYDDYARARFYWNRRNETDLRRSLQLYYSAIELAPGFAPAYAGLAGTYAVLGFYQYLPPAEAFSKASLHAKKALEIDPELADAVATLAYIELYFEWDWNAAESLFKEAISLNPQNPVAHQWYGNLLVVRGRWEDAKRELQRSLELDPLSLIARSVHPWMHYYSREYHVALDLVNTVIELDGNYFLAHYWKGWILQQTGDQTGAIDSLNTAVQLSGRSAITLAALARAYAVSGSHDKALEILAELVDPQRTPIPPSYEIAKAFLALERADEAFAWLERAYDGRANQIVFAGVDPELDILRGTARFEELIDRLGL
jgi:tetratricopeptide (TPR) repeat protein